MKIGNYELYAIETGRFALDGGAMFGVVPKTLWEKAIPPDEKNRIDMAARALLLIGNGRKILIDVGNGSKFNEKLRDIYKIDNSRFTLLGSLQKLGITATEITDVILTHLHFDHAGGSTYRENGTLKPTFPNARYYVQRAHWEAANNPTERDRASFFPDDFRPLQEYGLLNFTEGEGEILPGISCRVCNGHTTALQAPVISDGRTTLLYCADLVPTIAHVPLPWIMAYDLRPLVTLEEKRRILTQAVDENWILFFEHDASVETARLQKTEKGFVAVNPASLASLD
ncbi:MAG TPA: MBL fold metallo-hydrolase [Bacteroidota bacterium]|nr:MBL fold metallo-hydrolase [Bacteroidota bacterium]